MFNIHEVVSVEEKEVLLFELLDVKERVDLMELFGHADNPDDLVMHIITAFFAILKMSMEKTILIEQEGEFGTIWLRKRPDDWDDVLTERHAHDFEDGSGLKPAKGKASSYSVLTQEALDAIRKAEEKEEEEANETVAGNKLAQEMKAVRALYVVDPSAPRRLKRIEVQTGLTDGNRTEVSSPLLKAGDRVVVGSHDRSLVRSSSNNRRRGGRPF